ncbi:phage tail protein [Klebsiella pneumoniae]|uniref:Tail protein n=7 Tax=root TaxID=1 RepID=A0A482ME41_9CAUD|nr:MULTISPECIES: phage tail protein [Klebsiella]YP_009882584.1 tail collar fiber protein [Klebsiella phage ST147-VIM1phi7.1]AIX86192.1 phage tail protein [Klebsiella pneumoniae subsp. pneumoniae]ANE68531.1 phage tail protein [Klebsiella pneumoniae]ANF43075.1 phage tail protein [Klebsiella pneumoniae]ANK43744.1 phage tail protein [Klebsiella pneumoniae]AOR88274.1 phage tail protein [Klebsiella pneumoniae subsp. pneumoniae]
MAGKKYIAILTPAGEAKMAAAAISGEPVGFSHMGVGDGGGTPYQPYAEQTGLVNELYRAPLNRLVIADSGANVIRAEMVMFPQVGGFWLREAALYDDDGVCLALASLPPSYKPLLAEGSGRQQAVNLWIAVNNTADVRLMTDPAVVIASLGEVDRAKNEAKDYADKIINELDINIQQAITEAVKTAVRDAWEEDNPPGTTRFFNQNLNPNERWPWSQWIYTGENKTIRVAKADGSNVGNTGGSDTVTLLRANLPAVQIDVTGETSEQEQQELTTSGNGRHRHRAGDGAPGDTWQDATHGTDNQKYTGWNYTDYAEDHQHSVTIPPHKHSTSGKTADLGEGKSFSVVEAHTLLMCWSRVA